MSGQSILRNLFHFSGIVIPLAYLLINRDVALGFTIFLFCVLSVVEFLRITGRLKLGMAGKYLKEKEAKKPTGSLFYVVAALVVILLFRKEVAICSLFVLCISDPLSSLVGRRLGRHPLSHQFTFKCIPSLSLRRSPRRTHSTPASAPRCRLGLHLESKLVLDKTIEGTLAFFGSSLIILALFSVGLSIALLVACVATLTELCTPGSLDDNLTIPIMTGVALTLLGQ